MNTEELTSVFKQAYELGTSIGLVAGGEPLMRDDIIEIMQSVRGMIFLLFTNGLLLDADTKKRLRKAPNVVPIVSIEGHREQTDERRGDGVYARALSAVRSLQENNRLSGISFTVTSGNLKTVTGPDVLDSLYDEGCRIFIFVEYTPIADGTEHLVLSEEQREELESRLTQIRNEKRGLFISFPGDEKHYGGCLAAGRGFVHVNGDGSLEPCPFSPYSDMNLKYTPLKNALGSELLKTIRENPEPLEELGGCSLWKRREWVQSLLS